MAEMKQVRPVVETGYENLVQVRLLLEARPGTRPDDILERWGCVAPAHTRCTCHAQRLSCHVPRSELLPRYMSEWKLERAPLVELFGRCARSRRHACKLCCVLNTALSGRA